MASAIPTVSTTLEGQVMEVIFNVQAMQNNPTNNPNSRQIITTPLSINTQTGLATVSLQIPIGAAKDTDGSVDTTPVEVFVNS